MPEQMVELHMTEFSENPHSAWQTPEKDELQEGVMYIRERYTFSTRLKVLNGRFFYNFIILFFLFKSIK